MKNIYNKAESNIFGLTGILLLLAVMNLPYGYYNFLRIIVTLSSLYLLVIRKSELMIIGLLIAILFNPILPIYLTKDIWIIIDIIIGAFYLIIWWNTRNPKTEN